MELELEMEMESKSQSKSDDCHGDEQLLLLLLTAASWAVVSAIKWSFKCNNNKANNDYTMYRRTLSTTTTTTIAVTVKRLRPLLNLRQRTRIEPNRDSSCLPLLPAAPSG